MISRLVFLLLVATTARAHDFWIEPSTFRPEPGETILASLRVGEHFEGEPVPRSSELIDAFIARDARGTREVGGFEGEDPAGVLVTSGPAVIGYRSRGWVHELAPAKFAQFLDEEGVRGVPRQQKKVRERFYRYAKSLIGEGADAALGFRYEIVRESRTRFRVFFEEKPLAGVLVVAMDKAGARLSARTDANGRVALELPGRGVWLVKSVHVVRAPADSGDDWQSLWASVTFDASGDGGDQRERQGD